MHSKKVLLLLVLNFVASVFPKESFVKEIEYLLSFDGKDVQEKVASIITSKKYDASALIRLKNALDKRILFELKNKEKYLRNIFGYLSGAVLSGGAGYYYFGSDYLSRRKSINQIYDYFSSHGVRVKDRYSHGSPNTTYYDVYLSGSQKNLLKVDHSKLNELIKLRNIQEGKKEPLIWGQSFVVGFLVTAYGQMKAFYACRKRMTILLAAQRALP